MLLLVCGCQGIDQSHDKQITSINQECPEQPLTKLSVNNVKEITLTKKTITESGKINQMTALAYTFQANAEQKLMYQTNQDLCIWIYTPDNQLLKATTLPKKGKYIIQLESRQGSQNFDINLSLSDPKTANSSPEPSPQVSHPLSQNQILPDQFIKDYYSHINNRNYSEGWDYLSPDFRDSSGTYTSYQEWWNKVQEVQVRDIQIIQQTDDSAILKVELNYVMNSGRVVIDKKPLFYLIWNRDKSTWMINKKSSS